MLFLGGWQPAIVIPGFEWPTPFLGAGAMLVKIYAMIFGFLWVRATLPPLAGGPADGLRLEGAHPAGAGQHRLTGVLVVALPSAFQVAAAA